MLYFLDGLWIDMKSRMVRLAEEMRDESGVSAFVATILLILIVVLLCALFWTKIDSWFTTTWDKITQQSDSIG